MKCRQTLLIFFFSVISLFAFAKPDTLWKETWEGNWTDDWYVDGGTWEVGTPTSGPNKAYIGKGCAATVLNGNYNEGVKSRLIRYNYFVIPEAEKNPRLRFWHWYSFSEADYGEIQIKEEGGTWVTISPIYSGTSSNCWTSPLIDLNQFSKKKVQIALYLTSKDNSWYDDTSTGWYVDDLSIITGNYNVNITEGWESGLCDWSVDKGTWEVGKPTNGPLKSKFGINCLATVLNGNYHEGVDSRIISPFIVIWDKSLNPRLRFWHWFSFSEEDKGFVQIREEGQGWIPISPMYNNSSSNTWTYTLIDLSAYSNKKIQIAFWFVSKDNSWYDDTALGWYIDNLKFETGPYGFNTTEDWEIGIQDWNIDRGTWEVGIPLKGPTKAHGGLNCLGTVLEGNYHEGVDSRTISTQFMVQGNSTNPALKFWHWFDFSEVDFGEIQIKEENGNWKTISPVYSGSSSNVWTFTLIDLNAYTNKKVQIAFHFYSKDNSWYDDTGPGWYIDDITFSGCSPLTDIKENNSLPTAFQLFQNYPNPFNPSTTIDYQLSTPGFVTLKVYDVLGREVATLVNEFKSAGKHKVQFDGNNLASGVYWYRIQCGAKSGTKKLTLIK